MKLFLYIICLFCILPLNARAQSYQSLWKQANEAASKDLPKTEMEKLSLIIDKAKKGRDYGQLLKATLKRTQVMVRVTPDSLKTQVAILEQMESEARHKDPVMAAVWQTILGSLYRDNTNLCEDLSLSKAKSKEYFAMALKDPALLASHKASEYVPLVVEGYDGRWFDNDLLSVVGYEAGEYKLMHDYYVNTPLRTAACLTACEMLRQKGERVYNTSKSESFRAVDSLLAEYGDIKVAGELALLKFQYIRTANDQKVEDQINFINYALSKWGSWPRTNRLRNAEKELTNPEFSISSIDEWSLPQRSQSLTSFSLRNIQQVTMTVSRLSLDASKSYNLDDKDVYAKVKSSVMPLEQYTQTRRYDGQPAYMWVRDSLEIPALPVGMYLVEVTTNNKNISPQAGLYYVSDMHVIALDLPDDQTRYCVVSATTGQPKSNARLRLKVYDPGRSGKNKVSTVDVSCDGNGEAIYKTPRRGRVESVFAYTETDKYTPEDYVGTYFAYNGKKSGTVSVNMYSDRSIYRPGQKVNVALIAYSYDGDCTTVANVDEEYDITLYDANHKKVGTSIVRTDAFGKAYTSFDLPESGLTGRYSISTRRCSIGIRVEQYKRPTFEVSFPEVHEQYQAGDTLMVKGRAMTYSGVPVQDAEVRYTVGRESAWWWYASNARDEILTSTTRTDDEGYFTLEMPMILPDRAGYAFYSIVADAEVTDVNGETREGSISLPLGTKSTMFRCSLPAKTERDSLKTMVFEYKNMAGAAIDAEVTYYIDNSPKTYKAPTNQTVPVGFDTHALPSGKHTLVAYCGNDTLKTSFVLFGIDDKTPCETTHDWFYANGNEFPRDGSPVSVMVGSSDPDTRVYYTMISGNDVLEQGTFEVSNSIVTQKYGYQDKYGDALLLCYAWVKQGKTYTHKLCIRKPYPDKRLIMHWKTFRDRLTPGQKEQWTLSVAKPDGTPAEAQVLAAMYDKSLDQIAPHSWHFSSVYGFNVPSTSWGYMQHPSFRLSASMPYKQLSVPAISLNRFDNSLFDMGWQPVFREVRGGRMFKSAMANEEVMAFGVASTTDEAMLASPEMALDAAADDIEQKEKGGDVQIRENLDETAFFMPDLMSDADGNVVLKFTLPESVTTWRFMSLATDKAMNYGMLDAEAVAQKDVMVQPNVPRFMRIGDKATIAARISNISEKNVTGKATLTLIDPETEKTVLKQVKDFALNAGQVSAVTFDVAADGNTPVYVCRVVVSGKGFSDGEQQYLPVLPSKETVIRTYPFTQHEPGRIAVKLDKLFADGAKDPRLTIEYTNNPAWLVLQTMPSLSSTVYDDILSQASAYYSNSIGSYLLNLSPAIRDNIKAWQQESGNETSLNSNLQKNQELKDLVLAETPWVRVAEDEEAQKRQLADYFDEAKLVNRLQNTLYKMKKLQNNDGSWSWWPGMSGSPYLTAMTAEILVRLNHMIGKQANTQQMLTSAINYLGNALVKEVKDLKKLKKDNVQVRPSETAVQTMYAFALDGRKLPTQVSDAQKYLIDLLGKQACELTIYGKAIAAVIFDTNKEKKLADEYLESISQYTVTTDEMGRYFDTPRAMYSWRDYRIPTQVAAIEAYKMVRPDDCQAVEEMRRWLLQEKRSHMWSTNINTVDAAYAFLDGNLDALDNGEQTRFTIDGKYIKTPAATAGIGYIKTTVSADGTKAFAAEKTSKGTSWGALYAQFEQQSTEVEASGSHMTVRREILDRKDTYKIGDKVRVRITVTAERDLDFVQVVDRRAACMEPVNQLSGYRDRCYRAPQDNQTCYFFDRMAKGTHVIETEYYIDRAGTYDTGTCRAQCAYAPEYESTAPAITIVVQ